MIIIRIIIVKTKQKLLDNFIYDIERECFFCFLFFFYNKQKCFSSEKETIRNNQKKRKKKSLKESLKESLSKKLIQNKKFQQEEKKK